VKVPPHKILAPIHQTKTFPSDLIPADVLQGMTESKRLLASKNAEYLRLIQQRAEAERVYNIAVAEKTMRLRSDGESISLVDKLVKGDKYVAQCKLNLEIAIGIEKACAESMKDIRSDIDSSRSLLSWLKAEMQSQ